MEETEARALEAMPLAAEETDEADMPTAPAAEEAEARTPEEVALLEAATPEALPEAPPTATAPLRQVLLEPASGNLAQAIIGVDYRDVRIGTFSA
jgi:hypothetical protein